MSPMYSLSGMKERTEGIPTRYGYIIGGFPYYGAQQELYSYGKIFFKIVVVSTDTYKAQFYLPHLKQG